MLASYYEEIEFIMANFLYFGLNCKLSSCTFSEPKQLEYVWKFKQGVQTWLYQEFFTMAKFTQ